MTVKLYLRPSPREEEAEHFEWALYSYIGEPIGSGESTFDELVSTIAQNGLDDVRLHYIIPAHLTILCQARIPAKQARYIQQALPFAVEEVLAEDVEDMHLVPLQRQSRDILPVLAIQQEVMAEYHALVNQFPWELAGIYVDAEGCPPGEGGLSLMIDGDDILLHEPGEVLMRLHRDNALLFLETLAAVSAGTDNSKPLHIWLNPQDTQDSAVFTAQLEHIDGLDIRFQHYDLSAFQRLSLTLANEEAPNNLCVGAFRSRSSRAESPLRKWWPVAAVAGVFLAVQVGLNLGAGMLHEQHAETYSAQARELYQRIYPGERNVRSPRRQMEGKLRNANQGAGGGEFLELLAEAGFQLKRQADSASMELNNLQFSQQRGELSMEVRGSSLDQLDQYKQALGKAGLEAGLGSALRESDGVRGRITVKRG